MKLFIVTSLLLSDPAALAFAPQKTRTSLATKARFTSALNYIDESNVQDGVDMPFISKDDPIIAALASQLKFTDDSLRCEYEDWSVYYEKNPTETRYATFKKNFLVQEAWNRENGQRCSLDEYGDSSELSAIASLTSQLKFTDDSLRCEYEDWSVYYEKTPTEARFATFKKNFLMQEARNRRNGQRFSLDGNGDSSELDAIAALAAQLEFTEDCLRSEYRAWSVYYAKTPDQARYATFKTNFLVQEAWNYANGRTFSLDEYGDSSELTFHLDSGPTFESSVFAKGTTPSAASELVEILKGVVFLDPLPVVDAEIVVGP